MPQSSTQYQAGVPQNAVSGAAVASTHGTEIRQQRLHSSPDSGVIVFSSSARILHMNGPARALITLFGKSHEHWQKPEPESLPSILMEVYYDVFAQLRHRLDTQDWAQFEIRRICHMVTPPLLLTGFGVPHSTSRELRIILTLDLRPSSPGTFTDAPCHYQPDDGHIIAHRATSRPHDS